MNATPSKNIRIRLPAPVTDPELRQSFHNLSSLGFDINVLWSSLIDRLGCSVSDETWLYHMDAIQEGFEDNVNDTDVHSDYREQCRYHLDHWDEFFESCRVIYAHACSNYSMLASHPVFQAMIEGFVYDPLQGHLVVIKDDDGEYDDEIKQSLHPTHKYPYRDKTVPPSWN